VRQLPAFIVVAESDDLRGLGAGGAEEVDAQAVAVIDLGPELARQLDLARLLVDDRHADALRLQHLGDGLAEAAVADHDRAGLGGQLGPVEPVGFLFAPLEPVRQAHQERCRDHRNGDYGSEQGCGRGED
jgi:hypothetical protein